MSTSRSLEVMTLETPSCEEVSLLLEDINVLTRLLYRISPEQAFTGSLDKTQAPV